MITSNADKLAVGIQRRSEKYLKEVGEAVKENTRLVYKKARQFSNREFYTLKRLREMGHPFAALHPNPAVAAHAISKRVGRFYRAWHWNFIHFGDGVKGTIWNKSFVAKFMLGTKKMVKRPILEEAISRTKTDRDRNVKNARRRGYYRLTGL